MAAHWALMTERCHIQGSSALAWNREWAWLSWDTELYCSRYTKLAEMDESASCNCRNRNLFPVAQSKECFHFTGLFMRFGTKRQWFWFLCSHLHGSAWEVTAFPVWRSRVRVLASICFECHLSARPLNVFPVPALCWSALFSFASSGMTSDGSSWRRAMADEGVGAAPGKKEH